MHRFNDLVRVAAPYWNRLSDDDKRGWKTRARDYKSSDEFASRRREARDRNDVPAGPRYMAAHNANYNPRRKQRSTQPANEFEDDEVSQSIGYINRICRTSTNCRA